jgi:hypothetical protein
MRAAVVSFSSSRSQSPERALLLKRITLVLLVLLVTLSVWPPAGRPAQAGGTLVAEGNDFATQVLGDPWDMNALTDVSVYLNRSGQAYDTQNIQVANGVFSAQSTGTADTNFSVLFPGYPPTIKSGREGARHPINSATYQCLYVAMRVDGAGSQAQVLWFETDQLNLGTFAQTAGTFTLDSRWYLYTWDLTVAPALGTAWTSRPTWQGLRIDPTNQANRTYAVDWARLTDCDAVNHTVTWSPNGSITAIWIRPAGTTRDILVRQGVSGNAGSAQLDVQGFEAGTYAVRLGTDTSCCIADATSGDLIVNQAPIAEFLSPSPISGADYASQAGNTWDFADQADLALVSNTATTLSGGALDLVTQSSSLPAGSDAQVWLNSPAPLSGSQYRYLSFRMFMEWAYPWPNVTDGMVIRWIWSIPGASGAPANRCYLVSEDIPFDLGWQTYVVDLHHPAYGQPEDSSVADCPSPLPSWSSSNGIIDLRFDPNENVTGAQDPITNGGPFHQIIDWIRLTSTPEVSRGTPYLVQVDINRPANEVTSVAYYYTTTLSDPTQTRALAWTGGSPAGPNRVFLPFLGRGGGAAGGSDTLPQADLTFRWDTRQVPANTYYLCAVITISPNTATYCSDAPVIVH